MNEVDRWINLEGPEPPLIRELLSAARDVPDLTPEQAESMDHSLRVALAAQRRRWARERSMKGALAAALFAACAAAALALVLRSAAPADPTLVHEALQNAIKLGPTELGATDRPAPPAPLLPAHPSASAASRLPDAGAGQSSGDQENARFPSLR